MRAKRAGLIFRESLDYVSESKNYILLAFLLFLAGAVIGYAFYAQLSFLDEFLRELIEETEGMNAWQLIVFIFTNNLQSAFFVLVLGGFFGIIPLINALSNGVVLGYVFLLASVADGWTSIWRILPHGIFELPAILIAMGLGMRLGFGIFGNYFSFYKKDKKMRVWGIIYAILAAFGSLIALSSLGVRASGEFTQYTIPMLIAYTIFLIVLGLALMTPFIRYFFFKNRKLREMQKQSFASRLYISLKVFFMIILPLLIIAAIIEGLLIAFLK